MGSFVNIGMEFVRAKADVLYNAKGSVYIPRSRTEGEKDLMHIARDENNDETAWVFLEDKCVWFSGVPDIEDEEKEQGLMSVCSYFFDYAALGRRITHYHTHVLKGEIKVFDDIFREFTACKEWYDNLSAEEINSFMRNFYQIFLPLVSLYIIIPSVDDLLVMHDDIQRTLPSVNLEHCVVSPYGVCTARIGRDINIEETLMLFDCWLKKINKVYNPYTAAKDLRVFFNEALDDLNKGIPNMHLSFRYPL